MEKENKNLNELEKKFDEGKKYASNLQEESFKIADACSIGKEYVDFLKHKKDLLKSDKVQSWLAGANATISYPPHDPLKQVTGYAIAFTTTASSVTVMSSPSEGIFNGWKFDKRSYFNYEADMKELDKYLRGFNAEYKNMPDLVKMRKSAWDLLSSVIDINLLSAAHPMREILSKVIGKLAPNKNIMECKWWKAPEGKPTPDLRQRLIYLMYGSSGKIDERINLSLVTVEEAFEADTKLKKVAHGSKELKLEDEVKECMRKVEYALLTIFRMRELLNKS